MHSRICIDSGKGQVLDTPFRHKKRQDECERLVKGVAIDVTTTASSSRAIFPMQTIVDYHLIIPPSFLSVCTQDNSILAILASRCQKVKHFVVHGVGIQKAIYMSTWLLFETFWTDLDKRELANEKQTALLETKLRTKH